MKVGGRRFGAGGLFVDPNPPACIIGNLEHKISDHRRVWTALMRIPARAKLQIARRFIYYAAQEKWETVTKIQRTFLKECMPLPTNTALFFNLKSISNQAIILTSGGSINPKTNRQETIGTSSRPEPNIGHTTPPTKTRARLSSALESLAYASVQKLSVYFLLLEPQPTCAISHKHLSPFDSTVKIPILENKNIGLHKSSELHKF